SKFQIELVGTLDGSRTWLPIANLSACLEGTGAQDGWDEPPPGAELTTDGSQQLGAHEQGTHGVGRLHREHRVLCRAFERGDGVLMQRTKFHPLDGAEIGQELVGLAYGGDRKRIAVQTDLERRAQRGTRIGWVAHGLLLDEDGLTKGQR